MGDITRLLLLLLAGVTVSSAVDLYKILPGGQPCNRPYHVKIVDHFDYLICGGSLISDRWILTAAHCWTLTMYAVIPGRSQRMIIKTSPKIHSDNNGVHDIMLLELSESAGNARINLPTCPLAPGLWDVVQIAGHAATITGPNYERMDGEVPDLHCADIPVVDCADVRTALIPHEPSAVYEHWFCGYSGQVDVSHGDSGGGVVWNDRIYGINAATGNATFAFVAPAVFMDVCRYLGWIRATTGI